MRAARFAAEVPASLLAAALGMAGIAARSIPSDHTTESAADACSRGVVPVVAVGGTFEGDIASHDGTSRAGILLAAALGAAACHVVVDTADGPASEDVPDVASFAHARVFAPAAFVGSIVPPDTARLAASAGVELVVYHHCAPARPIGAPFSARGLARRAGGAS